MSTEKMVRIPFSIERAKEIQEGKEPGRIVLRGEECQSVEILKFDLLYRHSILAIVHFGGRDEIHTYHNNGKTIDNINSPFDLLLEVPEWMFYRENDILKLNNGKLVIFKKYRKGNIIAYAILNYDNTLSIDLFGDLLGGHASEVTCYASQHDKQRFIDAFKKENNLKIEGYDSKTKEYLKRFFGIEEKPKCEFQPYDRVLVRCLKEEKWLVAFFSHYDPNRSFPYRTTGDCSYKWCIPYNEKTEHLVGTNDEWND